MTGEPPVLELCCHSTVDSKTGLLSAIVIWELSETDRGNSSLILNSLNYINVIVDEVGFEGQVGFRGQVLLNERLIGAGQGESIKQSGLGCAYEVHPNASGYFFIRNLSFGVLQGDNLRFDVRTSKRCNELIDRVCLNQWRGVLCESNIVISSLYRSVYFIPFFI